eukprot:scaffold7704_cov112-Isochrysis_galbana.AAC.22
MELRRPPGREAAAAPTEVQQSAVGDVRTPTLTGTYREPQRTRPPKLALLITMLMLLDGPASAAWNQPPRGEHRTMAGRPCHRQVEGYAAAAAVVANYVATVRR